MAVIKVVDEQKFDGISLDAAKTFVENLDKTSFLAGVITGLLAAFIWRKLQK